VAIDPAATSSEDADEIGMFVADRAHRADRVIAEVNNGGEMVEATLRVIDPNMPFRAARPSRRLIAADGFCAASCDQQRSFGTAAAFSEGELE